MQEESPLPAESIDEELAAIELSLCQDLPVYRLEHHLYIRKDDGPVELLEPLKPSQRKLMSLILYLRERKEPVRIIILKARKTGISTVIEGDMFCQVLDREIDALVLAHDLDTTKMIFSMTQLFYDRYDLPKPETRRSNQRELIFAGHHGRILVQTANNKMAGTGLTPQYCHFSEVAKWEAGHETAISLFQAVSDKPKTNVIHESTANGYDDLFYPTWKAAHENCRITFDKDYNPTVEITNWQDWNYFYPLFISVFDDPACFRPFASEMEREQFERSLLPEERLILEQHAAEGANLEYLHYRRYTLKNKCQNDINIYHQEHPETPEQAFIASGRPRLDRARLSAMPLEPGSVGRLKEVTKGWQDSIEFQDDPADFLTIFRMVVPGHRYVIGVDVAEGLIPEGCKDPDRSVAIALDLDDRCRQVATLCGTKHQPLSDEALKYPLWLLARYFNMAYLVIEIAGPGFNVAGALPNPPFSYPATHFYHIDDWEASGRMSRRIGWRTTMTTRHLLIGDLSEATRDGSFILHDRRTVEECCNLVYGRSGKVEAQKGFHDDHCFALGLALQGIKTYPMARLKPPGPLDRRAAEARNRTRDRQTGY